MSYLFLVSIIICSVSSTLGQTAPNTEPPCEIYGGTRRAILRAPGQRFKIKTVVGANSGTAREADYVEFQTMEKIYFLGDGNKPKMLFDAKTSIFGFVTHRQKRRFPFKRGQIELKLEPLINWNGQRIEMAIARHDRFKDPDKPERRSDPCKKTEDPNRNCIAGRGNAPVAPVITAIAGVATGTVAGISKEEETRFIAATAFFSLAKELGNVLTGVEVEVAAGEIFDLFIQTPTVCVLPEAATPPPTLLLKLADLKEALREKP